MITLNNRPYPYTEGMTVKSLMDENNFVFKEIIVNINGEIIREEDWLTTPISDGDDVKMIHVFGGG
jgi:sulfur carrier protein